MILFDTIDLNSMVPSYWGVPLSRRLGKAKRHRIVWWRKHHDARKRRRQRHANRRLRDCKRDVRAAWRKLMDEHHFGTVIGSDFARTASKGVVTALKRHMGMPRVPPIAVTPHADGDGFTIDIDVRGPSGRQEAT